MRARENGQLENGRAARHEQLKFSPASAGAREFSMVACLSETNRLLAKQSFDLNL